MSFDALAPHYRWMEAVLAGSLLQRARIAHASHWARSQNLLLVGEGPGRLLTWLRRAGGAGEITVVDQSRRMLAVAGARLRRQQGHTRDTLFVQADLREWQPPSGRFDAIVTSCVLDCFPPADLSRIVPGLAEAARPGAWWADIDFSVPPRGWRRRRAQIIHRLMYSCFRYSTGIGARDVTPPDPWLEQAGFRRLARREFSAGLLRSELWRRTA